MFWKFRPINGDRDKWGRTYEEAFKEHALWCLKTLLDNKKDDKEAEDYLYDNCVTWIGRSQEDGKHFNSDAAFNAFTEIQTNYKEFKQYYPDSAIEYFKKIGLEK